MREDQAGIVVASDNPTLRLLCARAAHRAGLSQVRYALPSEVLVLQAVREFAPRIVVFEARFPGREHVELRPLRALRDVIGFSAETALVVVTSSDDRALERSVHAIGVDAFWRLPIDAGAFRENLAWLRHRGAVAQPDRVANAAIMQLGEAMGFELEAQTCRPVPGSVLEALCAAQELADPALGAHAQRVARLTQTLCRALDLGPSYAMSVGAGALLHDIGHLAVGRVRAPALLARGAVMATRSDEPDEHLAAGRSLLERLTVPAAVREAVEHHHERWDGRGRPTGYAGHEIPFAARLVAVCDVLDRVLVEGAEALEEGEVFVFASERLRTASGTVLDPDLVDTVIDVLGRDLPSSLTLHVPRSDLPLRGPRLRSQRL